MDTLVGWLTVLIVGALVGWLAGVVLGANARISLSIHAFGGFIGAILGGAVFLVLIAPKATVLDIWSLISALVGAAIVSIVLRLFTGKPIRLES